jgi:hypothetical protein
VKERVTLVIKLIYRTFSEEESYGYEHYAMVIMSVKEKNERICPKLIPVHFGDLYPRT